MPPQLDELLARVDQCSTQAIELSTHFQELREQIRQAIDIAQRDPEMSLIRSRKVLEYIVVDIYDDALKPKRAGTQPLESLVQTLVKEGQFPNRLAAYADMVRGLGNVGAHGRDKAVSSQDVLNSLSNLLPIVEWFFEHRKMPGGEIASLAAAPRIDSVAPPSSAQRIVAKTEAESQSRRKPESGSSSVGPAAEPARVASKTSPRGSQRARVRLWVIGAVPVFLAACGVWYVTHHHVAPEVITNSIGMKLTLIPAGEFMMGSPDGETDSSASEHPQHRVRITRPFYLGTYSVTRGQFARFVAATNYRTNAEKDGQGGTGYTGDAQTPFGKKSSEFSWRNLGFPQTDDHPVGNVSWNDAVAYCKWLSDQEGITYRLPTEAEWEYACRAGTTGAYFFGDDPEDLARYANVADATFKNKFPDFPATIKASDGYVFTAPAGSFLPSSFGLYDMHGNAAQWCQDWYDKDYYSGSPTDDPQGSASGSLRVIRGGSWFSTPVKCRSAHRYDDAPESRHCDVGFRVARELGPPSSGTRAVTPPAPGEDVAKLPAAAATPSDAGAKLPTITNSIGMQLTLIPAGEFLMGSPDNEPGAKAEEHPQHQVRISKPFYIGTYSVTRGQFAKFVAVTNYKTDAETDGKGGRGYTGDAKNSRDQKPEFNWRNTGFPQTDEHPVVNVSWNDAVAFCKWLGAQEGKTYRLPTEAEWEYACRAAATTAYYFGDNPDDLARYGNLADAAFKKQFPDLPFQMSQATDGYVFTAPVGSFRPNRWGLYDMAGNVWQWCSDWYGQDYYNNSPVADPQGPAAGTSSVRRGGGFDNPPACGRCSYRGYSARADRLDTIGFRVVREPDSPAASIPPVNTHPPSDAGAKPPTITNSIGMKLALIPAGDFMMGSPESEAGAGPAEHPQHAVRITRPFYLGTYPVTKGQFTKFVAASSYVTDAEQKGAAAGSWRQLPFAQGDEHPAANISWNDAMAFCRWLSEQEKTTYRLPTEAEWEYACRAGTKTAYYFGDDAAELGNYAWYKDNSGDATHPVGQKLPNRFGLYDMLGDVCQWCSDWWDRGYYPASPGLDPQGPVTGTERVGRGGGLTATAARERCAARGHDLPINSGYSIGFRVVREPDAAVSTSGRATSPAPSDASVKLPAITNSIGMKLTLIPAGDFMMGSPDNEPGAKAEEHPQHQVRIRKPFYLGTYSVTRGQFAKFVAATNYQTDAESGGKGGWGLPGESRTAAVVQKPEFNWRNPSFPQTDNHPVVNVSWNDAMAFCKWLGDQEGKQYRMPTEAQWEYACRAGTTGAYFFGDDPEDLAKYANVADAMFENRFPDFPATTITASDGYVLTAPVGSYLPNRFGLYDMVGNVWQWCSDWYGKDYYESSPPDDPQGPATGSERVLRGGGWGNAPGYCRCSGRDYEGPADCGCSLSFRVVREP